MDLKLYWPEKTRNILEFRQIAEALQPEIDALHQAMRSAKDEFFFDTLSDYGCKRWERIMRIIPGRGESLEERRKKIETKYLNRPPYTIITLRQYLASISDDFELGIDENAYICSLNIKLDSIAQKKWVYKILRKMLPANMVLRIKARIPHFIEPPRACVLSGVATVNRHLHISK